MNWETLKTFQLVEILVEMSFLFSKPYKFFERREHMGRRRKPKPPDIDFLEENSLPRYVSLDFMCEKYELSKAQCKEMARASGAFFEIRKASLI